MPTATIATRPPTISRTVTGCPSTTSAATAEMGGSPRISSDDSVTSTCGWAHASSRGPPWAATTNSPSHSQSVVRSAVNDWPEATVIGVTTSAATRVTVVMYSTVPTLWRTRFEIRKYDVHTSSE